MAESAPRELKNLSMEFTCNGQTTWETGHLLGIAAVELDTRRSEPLHAPAELRFRLHPTAPWIHAQGVIATPPAGGGLRIQLTDLPEAHRRHILEVLYPPGQDRRLHRRVSLVTQIRTVVDGKTLVGYSRDISSGGVFVETENPAAKGSEVTLRFKLRETSAILEVRALVVYALAGEGMGLKFLDPPPEVRRVLEQFVNEQT
jgi:uncharacterized protein (TIGR02266 family)